MTIPCSVLMCHAPIVIPAIGGQRSNECRRTTRGMHQAAARLLAHDPDVVVLISPHAPRQRGRFGVMAAEALQGDFARFGHPELRVRASGAPELAAALAREALRRGIGTWRIPSTDELDHGTAVPLWFLQEAGLHCPVLVVSLPYPGEEGPEAFGQALAAAVDATGLRVGLLASGDMSHRLTPGAPAGYDPSAQAFDDGFVAQLERGDLAGACQPEPSLRELAAEDVVDSCLVVGGATRFRTDGSLLLAYEGPFGVGYTEAILFEPSPPAKTDGADWGPALLATAHNAIARALGAPQRPEPVWPSASVASRGLFVTLRSLDGSLRGCIGHLEPTHTDLYDELVECAGAAATHDPRFPPVMPSELPHLRIEISLLSAAEPVADSEELDPQRYGVIVSQGGRRGVLLPGIESVDSVAQQLDIAARKAGLVLGPDVRIERFEVTKFAE